MFVTAGQRTSRFVEMRQVSGASYRQQTGILPSPVIPVLRTSPCERPMSGRWLETTMPYEVSFRKRVDPASSDEYINECCVGGDIVSSWLRPAVESRYEALEANQEDWGWFLWFRKGDTRLAIDIFTDDPSTGDFRLHLTSRRSKWMFLNEIADTPELEELRELVAGRLEVVGAQNVVIRSVDRHYM
jgi:hypothetical protein